MGDAIIQHLTQLSKDDPNKFQRLCDWHHYHLKGMALRDETFFQSVADLIPFETNEGPMSLRRYFEKAKEMGQSESDLLYFDERGSATQFYMLCEARGLLVVDASQVFEDSFLERYGRLHPEIKLRQLNIGESDFIFEPLKGEEKDEFRRLEEEFSRGMPDRRSSAKAVRFKPDTIPALTVLTAAAKSQEKLRQATENINLPDEVRTLVKDVMQGEKSIPVTLYLNAENSTIQKLSKMKSSEDKVSACIAIYNNALMLAQQMLTARNAEVMFTSFNRVIDLMISQTDDLQKLTSQVSQARLEVKNKETELQEIFAAREKYLSNEMKELEERLARTEVPQTEHVSCFFAMPFDPSYDPLLKAVRQVLEDKPYGWQVFRADESHQGTTISENVRGHIARSHCYLADISDRNPNVFLEIGRMSHYTERPLVYLCRQDQTENIVADLAGLLYLTYSAWDRTQPNIEALAQQIKGLIANRNDLKQLRNGKKTYLSADLLVRKGEVAANVAKTIAEHYQTVEEFTDDEAAAISKRLKTKSGAIMDAQDFLKDYYGIQGNAS